MFTLEPDRKVLVVGAGSGFGRAIAVTLAGEGAGVVAADIDRDAVAGLSQHGIRGFELDVTDPEAVRNRVAHAERELGGLDTLVYSAGVIHQKPLAEVSDLEWQHTLGVNLTGAFRCCQATAPALDQSGRGRIVLIGSIAGRQGRPHLHAYSASKFGLVGLCESLAVELAPDGITVNCLCPASAPTTRMGQMITGWKARSAGTDTDTAREAVAATFPLGRYIEEEDVVAAVLYLVSAHARNVTGAVLNVDGGKLLVS